MESSHKDILIRLRQNIIDDVDVYNGIIRPLASEYILKEEDVLHIGNGATKEDRAKILLDILPGRGPCAFDVFHQSLKNHYWWLSDDIDKLLDNYEVEHEIETSEVDHYAGLPSIPPVSPLTVTRGEKIGQLTAALYQLKPMEYIVLHGMKGFGKSCLTASTLKDIKLVKNMFANNVYWIKFSCDRPLDEEILVQLNTLYHHVKNMEIQPESFTPLEKDSLVRCLKYHFSRAHHRKALLILDDVFDKKIVNVFDFECKTLILTTDLDILDGRRPKVIEMSDGFTEAETLGLFAEVLETNTKELPIEAKKIHEECKGMPLLIAMFAAQFEEFKCDMKIRPDRWRHYLQSLKEKNAENGIIKEFLEKQKTIFDMCIDQLKPDLRKYYEELVVFNEDVNISPKSLEIIWGQNVYRVEELMLNLCHKSLAAKQWNNDLRSYIYGIHDLLLCHLRRKFTRDELTEMHKSVIEKYRKHCDNDFSKLPDDNYIHWYIGHHLEQARLFDEFPRLYLNFDFIQAKIMHTGLSDLLLDLKKYRKYITKNNYEYEAKVSDIEIFCCEQASIIAEHRRKNCLDIIQIAMNHPHEGFVAQNAHDLAMTRRKHLYLSHDKKPEANMPLSEEISTGICTSSFTDDPDSILMGGTSGRIVLWNCENKKQIIYNGYSDKCTVKKIIVSAKGDCFLTLTDTGIIKLFLLNYDEIFDDDYVQVSSPKQKQSCWAGIFTNSKTDDSLAEFSVIDEIILDMVFAHEDRYIAACTNKGTVKMWNLCGEAVFPVEDTKFGSITKITFTNQSSLLHIMDESKGAFYVYSNSRNNNSTYQYLTCYNPQLQEKKIVFFHHIPEHDNSLMIVTEKRAIYVKWFRQINDQIHNFNKQERAYVENDTVTYVCAAITYDGEYLVVADSGGFINVWNTDTGYQPVATYKSHVTSLDTYWLKDDGYHLICGNEKQMLHRWKLPVQESNALIRKSLFDAIVQVHGETDIVAKESHANKIIVLRGKEKIDEFESTEGKILDLQFFSNGSKLICITDKNMALLFNVETKEATPILKLSRPIEFLRILNINDCDIVVCRETDNNLKIWQNAKVSYVVENTGRVVSLHRLNDNKVITITQNGVVVIWHIDLNWSPMSRVSISNSSDMSISFSCLSHNKTFLAVLKEPRDLDLFALCENTMILPTHTPHVSTHLQMQLCFTHSFVQRVTYCDISQDERYIAVGFETGQISIIDIQVQKEIRQLSFHSNPIKQLSWAPIAIDAPILLSLANDELAWWNVALASKESSSKEIKRRSRTGVTHSTSTPSFNVSASPIIQIPSSRSADNDVSEPQSNEESNGTSNVGASYWKSKRGKDPEMPALLAAVELPQSRAAKVCISPDFTKFVTVDIYGSISTFKLFGYA